MSVSAGKEPGLFDAVILNDDLEEAYGQLKDSLSEVSVRHSAGIKEQLFVSNVGLSRIICNSVILLPYMMETNDQCAIW